MKGRTFAFAGALVACGTTPSAAPSPPAPPPALASSTASATPSPPASTAPMPTAVVPETAAAIFGRVDRDLYACVEQGRKKVPEMKTGRATIDLSVDASGKAACVVVSDGFGLTQDVEDCFSARLSREAYAATGAPWTAEIPVEIKATKAELGAPPSSAPALDMVETHGLPESAYDVIEALLPSLKRCTDGEEAKPGVHVMHVGVKIGKDGRVACALASSASALPPAMRECSANVFANAKFPPPRAPSGIGILSVPVQIFVQKR